MVSTMFYPMVVWPRLFKVKVISYGSQSLILKNDIFRWNDYWTPFAVNSSLFRRAFFVQVFFKSLVLYRMLRRTCQIGSIMGKCVAWRKRKLSVDLLCWSRWESRLHCHRLPNGTGRNCLSRQQWRPLSPSCRCPSWTRTYAVSCTNSSLVGIDSNNAVTYSPRQ